MKKVVILDDHQIVRDGLKLLLSFNEAYEVVGDYAFSEKMLQSLDTDNPDIIIVDLILPDIGGEKVIRKVKAYKPNIKLVVLSSLIAPQMVRKCLNAGAEGFLNKDCSSSDMMNCLDAVSKNDIYLNRELTLEVLNKNNSKSALDKLSERELDVFIYIAEGNSYQEIGDKMFISPKTVEKHNRNIQKKLNLNSLHDMIMLAINEGIISP